MSISKINKFKNKKIYDCFIYYNETEVLELRIKYLYDVVDQFIIYEFPQTFSGRKKGFNFYQNSKNLSQYKDKIQYYKFNEFYETLESLIDYIEKKNSDILHEIKNQIINKNNFYDIDDFSWILQSYQKNLIFKILHDLKVEDQSFIIISDLDEIPTKDSIKNYEEILNAGIYNYKNYDFKFFFNLMNSNFRDGCNLVARWSEFKKIYNIQDLKFKATYHHNSIKKDERLIGYHFSDISPIDRIIEKRNDSSHQELNNNFIKKNMKKRIYQGRDFYLDFNNLFKFRKYNLIDISNNNILDKNISKLLTQYPNYILKKLNNTNFLYDLYFAFISYLLIKLYWWKKKFISLIK